MVPFLEKTYYSVVKNSIHDIILVLFARSAI